MLTIWRRLILLWLFMFWQGGFLFYGAVVVTIGSDALGSDFAQGLITRRVAVALNLAGVAVLLAWVWDLLAEPGSHVRRRWAVWGFLVLMLGILFWLHPQMDVLIDVDGYRLTDRDHFRHLHRWYLRIATAQWIASIVFTFWTLRSWQASDRYFGTRDTPEKPHNR